jgi:putative phosphoesterase
VKQSTAVHDLKSEANLRVAILSDTHGFLDPRIAEAVARHDGAVHAGDVGGAAVLEALRPRRGLVYAVRGNNDVPHNWGVDEERVLASLVETLLLALPGGVLAVVHGDQAGRPSERHRRLRAEFPDAKAVVFGHSHHRCADKSARPWILNPGAAGKARAYGGPGLFSLYAGKCRWIVRELIFTPLR